MNNNTQEPREEIFRQTAHLLKEQFDYGLTSAEAVDHIAVEKADIPTGKWADVRSVSHSTVSGNVAGAREKINASRLDAKVDQENGKVTIQVIGEAGEEHNVPFDKEAKIMNSDGVATLELVYERQTAIYGYYVAEDGEEYEATLWLNGRPTNSFETFDAFDEWGSPEAKADTILWQRTED